jgi:hypothetical protein
MTFRSRPQKAAGRPVKLKRRTELPDYEKPLAKTGEARLWKTLHSGDRVEIILHHGNYTRTGIVDERTADGSTVWIILDHGMGRICVTQGDQSALVLAE